MNNVGPRRRLRAFAISLFDAMQDVEGTGPHADSVMVSEWGKLLDDRNRLFIPMSHIPC